ncbi:MAG: hypothetical protein ACOX9C_00240 [Kiritimatiellia bacterium]
MAASFWVSQRLRRRLGRVDDAGTDAKAVRGLAPLEWVLLVALAVYALSAVARIPKYYFANWPITTGISFQSFKAVQMWFVLLSFGAVPLFTIWDPRRWLPKVLAAGLVATQVACCCLLLRHTGFGALYSDDHPSFLFRISEFFGAFPWRENYVPHWNAGVANSVITSSGVAGYAILGAPLWLLLPPHVASPYVFLFAFVFFVPWMTHAGFRAAGLSMIGGLLGAIFALAQGPLFMLWLLRFGTVGASLSMAMLPSALAFLHAAAMRPRPSHWVLVGMVVSIFFMGQWPPMLMLGLPLGLLVLGHARHWWRSSRRVAFLLAATVTVAALIPTVAGSFLGKEVLGHVLENPSDDAIGLRAFRREFLTTLMSICADMNPLLLFAGLAGMWFMPWRRLRRWVVAPFLFLVVVFTMGPVCLPNMQLVRMGVVASCLMALPAACILRKVLVSRARFAPILQAVVLALVLCSLQNTMRYYGARTHDAYVGTRRIVHDLTDWIEANVPEDGRLLFAGSAVHAYGRGHIAYLPKLAGREMMSCDYYGFPRGMVEMNYPPQAFRKKPGGYHEFAKLHGVTHVISFRRDHIEHCCANPELFREVATLVDQDESANRDFVVFAVKDSGGRFAKGEGVIEADFNHIRVDFGGTPPEEAVIRYNWNDRLRVDPPAELVPHEAGDGVVFIGIRPNGASRVDVRYESRF